MINGLDRQIIVLLVVFKSSRKPFQRFNKMLRSPKIFLFIHKSLVVSERFMDLMSLYIINMPYLGSKGLKQRLKPFCDEISRFHNWDLPFAREDFVNLQM